MTSCLMLTDLAQHSSQVLPPTLDICRLNPISDLSSSSWQASLRKSWNGDLLILTPAWTDADDSAGAALAQMSFAWLAALLR